MNFKQHKIIYGTTLQLIEIEPSKQINFEF